MMGRRPSDGRPQLQRLAREEQRLVDAYQAEVIDLAELKARREQIRGRREVLTIQRDQEQRLQAEHQAAWAVWSDLEAFCRRVRSRLGEATLAERQQILQLLIDRIIVGEDSLEIRHVIPLGRPGGEPSGLDTEEPSRPGAGKGHGPEETPGEGPNCRLRSDGMSPAILPSLDPQVTAESVTDDHLPGVVPQDTFGDISPSGRGDGEDRHRPGDRRPQPHLPPALPPRGLADVGHGGGPNVLPELPDGGLQLGGTLPLQSGDHARGDRQARQVEDQLADGPLAEAVATGQDTEDRPQPWAEGPGGHARRQGRTGGGPAPGAPQAMGPVLVHHGGDRRHLGDLMSDRPGVITGKSVLAPSASERLAVDGLPELLGRYERTGLTLMAGLPAPLLARGGDRRTSLDRRGIGGGWLGRVGGVLVEPLLEVGDPSLEGLHQHRHRRLRLGWESIPDGLGKRWLCFHADVLLSSRPESNNGP